MTAVNEEGHTRCENAPPPLLYRHYLTVSCSGGLKKAGSPSGGCRYQDRGQTYTRSAWHGGRFAILFAWYWPKDQPRGGKVAGGHRHDWECAVVWLDDPESKTPTLLGAAVSGHGKFKKELNPPKEGDHVKLEYFNTFPLNHEMQFSQTLGKLFPIINWDNMTEQTREALQKTDFGAANVPFKEGAFQNNLQEAMLDIPVR